jgi:hypothetical protein
MFLADCLVSWSNSEVVPDPCGTFCSDALAPEEKSLMMPKILCAFWKSIRGNPLFGLAKHPML